MADRQGQRTIKRPPDKVNPKPALPKTSVGRSSKTGSTNKTKKPDPGCSKPTSSIPTTTRLISPLPTTPDPNEPSLYPSLATSLDPTNTSPISDSEIEKNHLDFLPTEKYQHLNIRNLPRSLKLQRDFWKIITSNEDLQCPEQQSNRPPCPKNNRGSNMAQNPTLSCVGFPRNSGH